MPDLGNTSVFSQTDGSNNSGTQPSWSGSAAPSTLDDAGRGLQGAVTREWNWRSFTLTAGGTADAKTLTYSVAPAAYYNGQRFAFLANTTNTTSATLNVNSLGAKTIKKDVSGTLTNLSASDMVSGMFVEVVYNTANDCFVWVNRGANILGTANTWSAVQTFTASPVISVTDNTNAALRITQLGTGNALVVEDETNPDSTAFVVNSAGNVGVGGTPTAKLSVLGTSGVVQTQFGSTAGVVNLTAYDNSTMYHLAATGSASVITGYAIGTQSNIPLYFFVNNAGKAQFNTNGDFLITASGAMGYGVGSGGTVTQITSKATGVTLNTTNGQIITHNASLGAASEVSFTVTNSTVAATDNIILTKVSGGTATRYQLYVGAVAAGSFVVSIRNVDSTAQSDVITFNFAVIKSVTS